MARRVSKDPDVRRDELLDAALALCEEVGYENLAVEAITTRAGVAKGTFYYYFRNKDAVVTALAERFGQALFAHLDATMSTLTGTGLERLQAFMRVSSDYKLANMDHSLSFLPFLYHPHNAAVRTSLYDEWGRHTLTFLAQLLTLGAADGSFDIDDPDTTATVVLALWIDGGNRMWDRALAAPDEDAFVDILVRTGRAIWTAQERVLGLAPGTLAIPLTPEMFTGIREPFLAALRKTGRSSTKEHS